MNYKKLLFPALLLSVLSLNVFSQSATTFGIRAGINFQNLNGKDVTGDKLENDLKVGFNAGITADIPVAAPDYFVQTGLLFSTKGAKFNDGLGGDTKVNLSYLEVPITLLYKPVLGKGRLLLGVGPYLGFAVGGKVDEESIKFEKEITVAQASSGVPYFKRFDAGGNIVFGYMFTENVSAQINAQLGLVNVSPKIEGGLEGDQTVKNTGFGLSLGYSF